MTNLPRGTDVISRAASHHTEQGRADAAVQRLEEGGRRKREGSRSRPRLSSGSCSKNLVEPSRRDRQTLRDTHVVAPVEHWKMDLVAVTGRAENK